MTRDRRNRARTGTGRRQLRVEPLERRQLPSNIYTVTNTLDDGSTGSLRWAITQVDDDASDSAVSPDAIAFNIPQSDAGYSAGVWTIAPTSALPAIAHPVVIDGYTQPGAAPNTNGPGAAGNAVLRIVLSGANAPAGTNGLELSASAVTVRGLVINGFATAPPSDNGGAGILIDGAHGDVVEGNFIGTDARGDTAVMNGGDGVLIEAGASDNTIGGTAAGAGNVIASNGAAGVALLGTSTVGNSILGNSIYDNAKLGIDLGGSGVPIPGYRILGIGPNGDGGAADLSTTTVQNGQTVITGQVIGTPGSTFTVELFASAAADPSGYGQGQTFLGRVSVTTTGTGGGFSDGAFSFTVPRDLTGQFISATATSASGDTSEFAHDLPVPTEPPTVNLVVRATPSFVQAEQGSTVTFGFEVTNYGPDAATNLVLTDELPAGLTGVQPSVTVGNAAVAGGTFTDHIDSLPSGSSVAVQFTATYAASTAVSDSLSAAADEPNISPFAPLTATTVIAPGIATATSLEVNPTDVGVGQNVTAYVVVNFASGAVIPTGFDGPSGTVTLVVDGVPQPGSQHVAASRSGAYPIPAVAVFPLHSLTAGPHDISATFTGDPDFLNSQTTQDVHFVVQSAPVNPTTMQIATDAATSSYGQPVTVTADVMGPPPFLTPGLPPEGIWFDNPTPSGTVTFFVDGKRQSPGVPLTQFVTNRTSAAKLTFELPAGTHQVTARYNGNGLYPPNQSAPISLTVAPARTSIVLTTAPNPSPSGGSVMLDATVTRPGVTSGDVVPPGGFVDFREGAATLAHVPVGPDGHARFTTAVLTVGVHSLVAVYQGDANDAGSTSNSLVQTVLAGPGPTVTSVVRYGPAIPSGVLLTFSLPLDPDRARDPANYRVLGPGRRPIGVEAVGYTPSTETVMLLLARNLSPRAAYRVTVVGTGPHGVTDAYGNLLDGSGTGRPGSDFTTVLRPVRARVLHVPSGPGRFR